MSLQISGKHMVTIGYKGLNIRSYCLDVPSSKQNLSVSKVTFMKQY